MTHSLLANVQAPVLLCSSGDPALPAPAALSADPIDTIIGPAATRPLPTTGSVASAAPFPLPPPPPPEFGPRPGL